MELVVENLQTHFRLPGSRLARAVDGISFTVKAGQTVALVGESGSGKSQTAYSIMRLMPENAVHGPQSRILLDGRNLLVNSATEMRQIRGNTIAMIFQEPMTSLNPLYRIGNQLGEPLQLHQGMDGEQARARGIELLDEVGLPDPETRIDAFPHELSGGMKQRVMIAMALACRPQLLIADEPTTALDVTVQAQILALMKDLQRKHNMAILLITHDLGVVYQMADEVCVMYGGRIAERGPRDAVFEHMAHPYTQKLFASIPARGRIDRRLHTIPGRVPPATDYGSGCRFAPRCPIALATCTAETPEPQAMTAGHEVACHRLQDPVAKNVIAAETESRPTRPLGENLLQVSGLKTWFPVKHGLLMRTVNHVRAVDDLDLTIRNGETVALVGESGCGKTTVGQSILRLVREARGTIVFDNQNILDLDHGAMTDLRRRMQIVFQDPFSSLSPRMRVAQIVGEGLQVHRSLSSGDVQKRVADALAEVGLSADIADRYPHEFSGGQRQRISIARAIILEPDFLVLDEPTSALDVSVQAQILNLLEEIQARRGLAYLFITHDLGVVRYIADRVAVMYLGRIVEHGTTAELFASPQHPYTRALIDAVPQIGAELSPVISSGDVPSPLAPPPGCPFHPRCPLASERCHVERPSLHRQAGTTVACHHPLTAPDLAAT